MKITRMGGGAPRAFALTLSGSRQRPVDHHDRVVSVLRPREYKQQRYDFTFCSVKELKIEEG